jgi:uncharacterized protein
MRVLLPGGSGFLGSSLAPFLCAHNHDPIILSRATSSSSCSSSSSSSSPSTAHWDARTVTAELLNLVSTSDAIVNLVGRSVDCRKTPANKNEIKRSRINSVRALASACAQVPTPPKVWIQTSTAHIYGDTADQILDENSPTGAGFAPEIGRAWEAAFNEVHLPNTRKVILRISFVLGPHGGAFQKLTRLARCFLGGRVASGNQYISWIHIHDLNQIILRALTDETMSGIYVVTAPSPVTNADFMKQLRRAVRRPWSPPTPAPLVRLGSLLLGTDPELALYGRRCVPTRLINEGFTFRFPTVDQSLDNLLAT